MAKMGTVSLTRKGNDAIFQCECGEYEEVANFEKGVKPTKFEWQMTFKTEHSACSSCKSNHNSSTGEKFS